MKYRILTLLGLMAISVATIVQAQDYDDIYYNASSSNSTEAKTSKVVKPAKTIAVYGEVPETYKVTANSNYRIERDVDEYNRRGVDYESDYELDINGDTIFEDAFANTRRIERFYNPDVVILSDDDDLVELYYDESPSINLIIGSDAYYGSSYGWGWASSYYPWYSWGSYYPWRVGWYDPWYTFNYGWYRPIYWGGYYWGWGLNHWYHSHWWPGYYGWDNWHPRHNYADWGHRPRPDRVHSFSGGSTHRNVGLANNRNGRSRVGAAGNRNGISARGDNSGNRPNRIGTSGSRNRASSAISRGGNMDRRSSSGVVSRNSGVSRASAGSRSNGIYGSSSRSSGSYSSGSRSSGSYSSGSRSSGSYSSGSRSSGSYSSGSRSSSGGGSHSSGGGGSHGGSSGGGGHRR